MEGENDGWRRGRVMGWINEWMDDGMMDGWIMDEGRER